MEQWQVLSGFTFYDLSLIDPAALSGLFLFLGHIPLSKPEPIKIILIKCQNNNFEPEIWKTTTSID